MNSDLRETPIEILLVEDSAGDTRLIREALKEAKVWNNLIAVADGETALRMLAREGEFESATRPHLILLDLNLPGMHGREVLKRIKDNEDLRRIPVVILTTSDNDTDVRRSYDQHANCFITKPVTMKGFVEVVKNIDQFWFSIVTLPAG